MIIAWFSFISWVLIVILFLMKKSLDVVRNIILQFCLMVLITNVFTILDLNLGFIQHSERPELFIGLCLQRSFIIPTTLLIFTNTSRALSNAKQKAGIACMILLFLCLIEYTAMQAGVKSYIEWNWGLTVTATISEMLISNWSARLIMRLN